MRSGGRGVVWAGLAGAAASRIGLQRAPCAPWGRHAARMHGASTPRSSQGPGSREPWPGPLLKRPGRKDARSEPPTKLGKWVARLRERLEDSSVMGRIVLPSRPVESYSALRERILKLDSSMQYNEYHTLRWSAALGSILFCWLYLNWDEAKRWFGTTSADITSSALRDSSLQREAQNLAQGVVYQLLNDEYALQLTTDFLNQLLYSENSRKAVLDLLANVAAREDTQTMLRDLFIRILTSPEFVNQASLFAHSILEREDTMIALRNLFAALYEDPVSQQLTADFFQHVMDTTTFRTSASDLGVDTTHSILSSEEVAEHAVHWMNDVLAQPDLRHKAGDAIWGAITSTFVPGFLGGGRPKKDIVNIDEAIQSLRREHTKQTAKAQAAKVVPAETRPEFGEESPVASDTAETPPRKDGIASSDVEDSKDEDGEDVQNESGLSEVAEAVLEVVEEKLEAVAPEENDSPDFTSQTSSHGYSSDSETFSPFLNEVASSSRSGSVDASAFSATLNEVNSSADFSKFPGGETGPGKESGEQGSTTSTASTPSPEGGSDPENLGALKVT